MSLTEVSYYLRKALPLLLIFGIFFLIIFYSFKLFLLYSELNKPKPAIAPKNFGRINAPEILDSTSSANFSFILDNIEGKPVTTTDSAKVYFVPKSSTRFGYREKIYLMAKTFGFDTEKNTHRLVDNFAFFEDDIKKLKIDITNFNFTFESIPNKNYILNYQTHIPSEKEIENKAIDFLRKINKYPDELAKGISKIIYIKYDPNFESYVNVENKKDANLIEVDFYRQYPDGVPVFSPKFFNSQNYVVLMFLNENNDYQVIKSQIAFFEKSDSQYDIYPIKSAELAWEELIKGKGKVVAATLGKKDIVIKKIEIGYYDFDSYQSFLQPVYLFLGEDNFAAYVPAITSQWLIEN
ncbi:MAG: hypothetical protein N2593_02660 [Patescibacteria group bacterium]|nr:hypothetical protein [Patescibacteria group bacterium]